MSGLLWFMYVCDVLCYVSLYFIVDAAEIALQRVE